MEIKVGEYVRTTDGYIGKLVKITNASNYYKIDVGREIRHMNYIKDNYIYSRDGFGHKHSHNIIDLIEVGDYVNGKEIHEIDEQRKRLYSYERDDYHIFNERDIQRVVTHEQMEEIEYKVNE